MMFVLSTGDHNMYDLEYFCCCRPQGDVRFGLLSGASSEPHFPIVGDRGEFDFPWNHFRNMLIQTLSVRPETSRVIRVGYKLLR